MIYLDHHATTPVDRRVVDAMVHALSVTFGNPNSDHGPGRRALDVVEVARRHVAALVGAEAEHVLFTSGATEALRLAISDAVARSAPRPLRVAAMHVEHRALLDLLGEGQRAGAIAVEWLGVDTAARLNLDHLEKMLGMGKLDLVCVMASNNEVGTTYPIERIARLSAEHGVQVLVDASQSAGREAVEALAWGIDYLTLSAHKMYGPKGVGALVVTGGPRPVRPGTPNVPGIVGFGEAARLRRLEMRTDEPRIAGLRDHLQAKLLELLPTAVVNGDQLGRLSNNLHVSVPGVPNDAVIARLHDQVAISTGAACTSGAQESSHVLQAMQLPEELQDGALRISLGRETTLEEVVAAAGLIAAAVLDVRQCQEVVGGRVVSGQEHAGVLS